MARRETFVQWVRALRAPTIGMAVVLAGYVAISRHLPSRYMVTFAPYLWLGMAVTQYAVVRRWSRVRSATVFALVNAAGLWLASWIYERRLPSLALAATVVGCSWLPLAFFVWWHRRRSSPTSPPAGSFGDAASQ
jgi:hypothetical protein